MFREGVTWTKLSQEQVKNILIYNLGFLSFQNRICAYYTLLRFLAIVLSLYNISTIKNSLIEPGAQTPLQLEKVLLKFGIFCDKLIAKCSPCQILPEKRRHTSLSHNTRRTVKKISFQYYLLREQVSNFSLIILEPRKLKRSTSNVFVLRKKKTKN